MLGEPRWGQPFEVVAPERAQRSHQCTFPCVRRSTRLFRLSKLILVGLWLDSVSAEEVRRVLISSVVLTLFFSDCSELQNVFEGHTIAPNGYNAGR